MGIFTIIK